MCFRPRAIYVGTQTGSGISFASSPSNFAAGGTSVENAFARAKEWCQQKVIVEGKTFIIVGTLATVGPDRPPVKIEEFRE